VCRSTAINFRQSTPIIIVTKICLTHLIGHSDVRTLKWHSDVFEIYCRTIS